MDRGQLSQNKKGIIQGSPLSPVLSNIALHGLQSNIEDSFNTNSNDDVSSTKSSFPQSLLTLIRYADDFIVVAPSIKVVEDYVSPRLTAFLKERSLKLNQKKTEVKTLKEGFEFLGFSFRAERDKMLIRAPQNSCYYSFLFSLKRKKNSKGQKKNYHKKKVHDKPGGQNNHVCVNL
jgi:RNA-directed DNA polymerase